MRGFSYMVVVGSLAALASGCSSSSSTGAPAAADTDSGAGGDAAVAITTADSVNGDWESIACELRPSPSGPANLKRKVHFDRGKMNLEFHYFSDAACTQPSLTFWFDGTYVTGAPSTTVPGALDATLTVSSVSVRPESEGSATLLGSAGAGKCGSATWVVGTKQDITATGCTSLGVTPAQVTTEYELLHVFRDQISFGARPVDGSPLVTAAKRPSALLVPAIRVGSTPATATTTADSVNGDWESIACELRPSPSGPANLKRKVHFDRGKMNLEFHYFSDAACTQPSLTFWFDGTYVTGAPSTTVPGALDATLTVSSVSVRPESEGSATLLGSAGAGKCGSATWVVGTKQDITATGCTSLGVTPDQVTTEYELLHVFRDQIFFGARPVDGSPLVTAAKRPSALLVPARRFIP